MWNNKTPSAQEVLLQQINELIRLGQGGLAKSRLESINTNKLKTASERTHYANLARRLSLPYESLKVLHPFVRPSEKRKLTTVVTDEERTEYAAALIHIGAITEAFIILKSLDVESQPQVMLFIAFTHIAIWDYEEAVIWLKKYLGFKNISNYQKLVAKANLCEALGHLNRPETENLIHETQQEALDNNYSLIFGHVQMTKAIYEIVNSDWKSASESLDIAEKYFSDLDTIESFFVRKWRAIMQFNHGKDHNLKVLKLIREEAIAKWNHWETVRDCDFYEATITKNEGLFIQLYFGTPYTAYRKRLLSCWDKNFVIPKTYTRKINSSGKSDKKIEMFSGESPERKQFLKVRKQISSLLWILASDFYRPMSTVFLFSKLFPDEFFNPNSSAAKVKLAIYHTRKWLKAEELPLKIEEKNGLYSLSSTSAVSLLIPQNLASSQLMAVEHKTDLLQTILVQKKNFTVLEASEALDLSRRSTNRLLNEAIEKGLLVRVGQSKSTSYTWSTQLPVLKKAG